MGMTFIIAESIDDGIKGNVYEIDGIGEYINLYDDMCDLIYKNRHIFGDDVDVFNRLDHYGHVVIKLDEIESFIIASKALIKEDILEYLDSIDEFKNCDVEKEEFIRFANFMIKICIFALANNKKIFSIGD